jgi:hypothetical protein
VVIDEYRTWQNNDYPGGGGGGRINTKHALVPLSLFVVYLNILSLIQIIAPSDWMIKNWNGCRRMWSLHNLKYHLGIYVE